MSKVITFSRTFPAYHPKAGQPTYFVEQIWNGLNKLNLPVPKNAELPHDFMWSILPLSNYGDKYHTIRAGSRFKVGDKFSPRVWSGKPYNSKQIIIAPDIEIKKIFAIRIETDKDYTCIFIDNYPFFEENKTMVTQLGAFESLAKNDGLSLQDLKDWFKYPKDSGEMQIICWNSDIVY